MVVEYIENNMQLEKNTKQRLSQISSFASPEARGSRLQFWVGEIYFYKECAGNQGE